MKKIVLLLVVIASLLTTESNAQSATPMPISSVAGADTISTSSSRDTVTKIITATGAYSTMGIQVNAIKTAGTPVSKAYLYSSLDGVTYNLTDSASAAFANTASAQAVWFTKTSVPYTYYKVQVRTPDGAVSTEGLAIRIYYVFRRTN